jgi:hypothetical protein
MFLKQGNVSGWKRVGTEALWPLSIEATPGSYAEVDIAFP